MLRRPSSAPSSGTVTGTAVLDRRAAARPAPGGSRRRVAGRDLPVATPAGGVGTVPRMRRPRGTTESADGGAPQRSALDLRIDRHLARLQTRTAPTREGAIDDDRARRDPATVAFTAIPAAVPAARPATRVASPADRPRTAEFPALAVTPPAV